MWRKINYLFPIFEGNANEISTLTLAHLGDAVFELMARTSVCLKGNVSAKRLHSKTVSIVSATAQAKAALRVVESLDSEETAVFKRGRNAHINSIPRASSIGEYHTATGIEALFGYLYVKGRHERLNELFKIVLEDD